MNALLITAGGGLGALCRYFVSTIAVRQFGSGFAWGTAIVNLAGCFLIGCVAGLMEKSAMPRTLWLFSVTGFLGGFTTFSTFSLETMELFQAGQRARALINVGINVVGGIVGTAGGLVLFARRF